MQPFNIHCDVLSLPQLSMHNATDSHNYLDFTHAQV